MGEAPPVQKNSYLRDLGCRRVLLSDTLNRSDDEESRSCSPSAFLHLPWPPAAPRPACRSRRRCACRWRWITFQPCVKAIALSSTWSPPAVTTDHQAIRWPTTTLVCRVLNQFPINVCGEVVKQIKSSELASALPAARRPMVSFEDVLPPQLIALPESGHLRDRGHRTSAARPPDCPTRSRTWLAPTAPPPTGFHATLDAQGPLLQWNVAAPPRLLRHLLPPAHLPARPRQERICDGRASCPTALGEDEARDSEFEWEQEYDYKIAAVTVLAVPGKPVMEVEGDDSNLVHLRVHERFPPAVPSGLQAVFSSVGQKPFIDLTWAPNTESDLAGYIVYRRSAGSSFVAVSAAPIKAPAWRDNDVHPGQRYYYTVAAVDVRGNQSAQSAPAEESVPSEAR